VELLWLKPAADGDGELSLGGRGYAIVSKGEVTGERGLVHARHALLEDASFEWDAAVKTSGDYDMAARFRNGNGTTTVAFDFAHQQLAHVESGRTAKGAAKIMAGWQTFADRHSPAGKPRTKRTEYFVLLGSVVHRGLVELGDEWTMRSRVPGCRDDQPVGVASTAALWCRKTWSNPAIAKPVLENHDLEHLFSSGAPARWLTKIHVCTVPSGSVVRPPATTDLPGGMRRVEWR
jgi:hypothetical protein